MCEGRSARISRSMRIVQWSDVSCESVLQLVGQKLGQDEFQKVKSITVGVTFLAEDGGPRRVGDPLFIDPPDSIAEMKFHRFLDDLGGLLYGDPR